MKWENLISESQFSELVKSENVFAVFKHSTRCSISSMAKNRLERDWKLDFPIYYLDLLNFRSISNQIAAISGVEHASPQLIVFQNGKVIYHESHNAITISDIKVA
ncbi:MAG TPA: bacillithiol system redox-active protein YtxJ [Chitinophagales bacterium]|jgi:bacillithiol system protein YtxJ|nr:bacillithiol system redox-active protein YtxJ [Chitinophagales bacterium]MBP6153918.1 bacillithiol system redox-active protein YtxJ [Chitinophagales bacterium]HQV78746.1 bacillithiol system redox-active protein YtxJ [Chitinophagales bacterium]HQW79112.1 bacillithiol system redox-active protein YtxJ [Chitinophagales bacterium]HRB19324.1 bacillithiol system redox-active protein YtxJ [Chitinophagales bacterium]